MSNSTAKTHRSIRLPDALWMRVRGRAHKESWPVRALVLQLLDDYADGRSSPTGSPAPSRFGPDSDVECVKRLIALQLQYLAEGVGVRLSVRWDDDLHAPVTRLRVSVVEKLRSVRSRDLSITLVELEDAFWDEAASTDLQRRVRAWFVLEVSPRPDAADGEERGSRSRIARKRR